MDPLSDVLRAVRLTGAYFYLVEASAPWGIGTCPARDLVPRILPDAEHLIAYHVLVSGSCWGGLEGGQQVRMEPGDVLMFPHGDAHVMSGSEMLGVSVDRLSATSKRYPETVRLGSGDSRETMLVCGFLGCDARPFNPLLRALPRRIHSIGVASGWLSQFPRQAVAEARANRAGSDGMLTRMAELMFVEVLRHHIERLTPDHNGWLAGLRDEVVGGALAELHEHPEHAWTLADLARKIATSRSVLAERFTAIVGTPPMLYLTRWRLQLAAEQLARGSAKVATISERVGYESEAAFSRAFKRETGMSPAAWRRARRGDQRLVEGSP
jgi:AraC-like DNA-binding protein